MGLSSNRKYRMGNKKKRFAEYYWQWVPQEIDSPRTGLTINIDFKVKGGNYGRKSCN